MKGIKVFLIQNLVLVAFKVHVSKSRVSDRLNLNTFLHRLVKERNTEKDASFNDQQKLEVS